jgi:hypothetical protein
MKILIRESKRDILAKQILNKKFPDLNVDEDDYKDSTGIHKRLSFDDGNEVMMVWGDSNNTLYFCYDVVDGLEILSYTIDKLIDVVGKWFSETFDLPVNIVRLVPKHSLN